MDNAIKDTIHNIHSSDTKMVISVTGAGFKVINWLLSVSGASKTLLEATIPYSESSQELFLEKSNLSKSVSQNMSEDLAKKSYMRATKLRNSDSPVIGIGCTAAISTNRNRKGLNEAFITIWESNKINTVHLILDKSQNNREEDEKKISLIILNQIAKSANVNVEINTNINNKDTLEQLSNITFKSTIDSLINSNIQSAIRRDASSGLIPDGKYSGVILPGSFNPLHKGHMKLKEYIIQNYDLQFAYEISISNVDKPDLDQKEILHRLNQFGNNDNVIIDKAPLFSEKSTLFPQSKFLIGYDTAERLINKKYYDDNHKKMITSLEIIENNKCSFLVAGRINKGIFSTLNDLDLPADFKSLFIEIPESQFRVDESSSFIRNRGKNEL